MGGRRTYRTKALVLDTTKLGEQDLIVTLLADSGAQLRAVAKGARKPGGRLAARSELFCETDFLIAKGRSLDVVAEASSVNPHEGLRGDLLKVSCASAICEIARLTCYEDAEDPFLYRICSAALTAAEQAQSESGLLMLVAGYAFKVLAHSGWWPQLDSCVACGDPAVAWFSASAGGLLCESCARDVAGAQELTPGELGWLRSLLGSTFQRLAAGEAPLGVAALMANLAHVWAATQLDARLRAFEFFLSV